MNELFQHPRIILEVLVAYWGFSAIVSGMPEPPSTAFWYRWLYATLHAFAGNLKQFADSRIQSLSQTTVITKTQEVVAPKETAKEQ